MTFPAIDARPEDRTAIVATLVRFPEHLRAMTRAAGVRVVALRPREGYCDRSPLLRRENVRVDDWPIPPAGLYVVEERTVYLRHAVPMTVAHEYGHALDHALGGERYASADPSSTFAQAFRKARGFVTPYAATDREEYAAEGFRAWAEVNEPASPWPRVSRDRLRALDPLLASYLADLWAPSASDDRRPCVVPAEAEEVTA